MHGWEAISNKEGGVCLFEGVGKVDFRHTGMKVGSCYYVEFGVELWVRSKGGWLGLVAGAGEVLS